ncbi:MAG: hypothetical protein RL141_292 [Candidatus Parcubacteria bacterium]|jgi:hypothetical protein
MKKKKHYPFTWVVLGVFCIFVGGVALAQPAPDPSAAPDPAATTTAQPSAAPPATSGGAATAQPAPTAAPSGTSTVIVVPVSDLDQKRREAQEKYRLYDVVLIGDATAQAYSDDTTSSFGGGLDFSTLQWNFSFALRIGADEAALSDEKAIGRFILTPENFGKPSLDVRAQYFPGVYLDNYRSISPRMGAQVYYRGSETTWAIPIDGMDTPRGIRGNVNAFGIGAVVRFVPIANSANWIELQGGTLFAMRIIGGDVALPEDVDGGRRALEIALDDRKRVYLGWEVLQTSIRIRALRAGFNLSYFPGAIDGLSNLQYNVSLGLHDGPVLSTVDPKK